MADLLTNITSALTPQNNYQANAFDTNALTNQLKLSQGNLGTLNTDQSALAKALLAQSQGQGPNPAQEMLNQATSNNIKQSAGFIASQKGISPALAARAAAENQANIQQQSAGQAATMSAEQELAAQRNLQSLYGQQGQQDLGNAQLSGNLVSGQESINAGVAAQNAAANQKTIGGLENAAGTAAVLASGGAAPPIAAAALNSGGGGRTNTPVAMATGGPVPAHFHPIAKIYHANFNPAGGTTQLKAKGGDVPGKAKVAGDSPANDTVKTILSPGEMVLPRSVMQSKDPAAEAAKFVAEKLKEHGKDSGSKEEFKAALKKAISSRKGMK